MTARRWGGILALAWASALPAATAEPAVKTLWASPFTLPFPQDAQGKPAPARISLPVTLGDKRTADQVCVERIGVRAQGLVDESVAGQFVVEPRLGADARAAPTLTVVVKQPAQLPPGSYELALRTIDCRSKSARPAPEALSLTLTRPAAKLEPLGKVTVDQWLAAPWSSRASERVPDRIRLRVSAESRGVPVGTLRADASPFTSAGTSVQVGAWKLDVAPSQASAGEFVEIVLAPSGFPVGTASGRLELSGRDLQTSPHGIEVELRTRLVAGWIPAVVGLGALLGFLLRVKLQQVIDLAKARKPGFDELTRVRTELEAVADREFRARVRPKLLDIERALARNDPAAISAALTTARTTLEAARSVLTESLKHEAARIDTLRGEFGSEAPLPAAVKRVCETAMQRAAAAADAVRRSDAALAKRLLDAGDREVREALVGARSAAQADLGGLLQAFGELSPLLSRAQRERLDDEIGRRRAAIDEARTPDDIAGLGHHLREMMIWLARALRADAERAVRDARLRVNTPSDLDTVGQAFVTACEALASQVDAQRHQDHGFAPVAWGPATQRATDSMRALLAQVVRLLHAETRKSLPADLLDLPLDDALSKIPLDNPTFGARRDRSPEEPVPAGTDPPGQAGHEPQPVPEVGMSIGAIEAAQQRNFLTLACAEAAMALGTILLLAIVCFAFYAERFLGTWPELLGLFFVGFSADLSADKLIAKVKELGIKT